jgi:hypothetical protein
VAVPVLHRPPLTFGAVASPAVETARREWEESSRALEAESGDPTRYRQLLEQVDAVLQELRKRIGQTFTLAELADEYGRAERWSRDAVEESGAAPWWPRTLSMVEGAAFHAYARGATDYAP